MRRGLTLYLRLVGIQIRAQMQYRLSFIFDILTQAAMSVTYFLAIVLIFDRFKNIGGWSLGEVAFLYGMVELSFGLMDMVFAGFDPDSFSLMVQRGTFDQLLLRPVNITLQVFSSAVVMRRAGRILQGTAVLIYGLGAAHITWTLAKAFFMPVILVSLVAYFGGLFIAGSTITFWTIERIEAVNMLTYGGTEMMSYPMNIYPTWLQRFFTFILPAIFLNYYPALFLMDKPDPYGLLAWAPLLTPLAGFLVLGAALGFWRFGVRHYQSTGS